MIRWYPPDKFEGKNKEGLTYDEVIIDIVKRTLSNFKEGRTFSSLVETKDGQKFFQPFNEKDLEELSKEDEIERITVLPGTDNTSFSLYCYYEDMDELVSPGTARLLKKLIEEEFVKKHDSSHRYGKIL